MIESVEVNRKQLSDTLKFINAIGKNARLIQARALNRTSKGAKTKTAKEINSEITLSQKVIKESIGIKQASQARPTASMTVAGEPVRLINFDARQTKKGVSFKVRRSSGRERYRHAFIATMKGRERGDIENGALTGETHEGVFERQTRHMNYDGRLPIKEKYGPSIPNVFEFTPGMTEGVLKESSERLVREVDGQFQRLLQAG